MMGLSVRQKARITRVFTVEDIVDYRALTRDIGLGFGELTEQTAVPGPLLAGMISNLLGTRLPGRGTNWLKQSLEFLAVAYAGERITAVVEITRLRPQKSLVNLRAACTNAQGVTVCQGDSLVLIRDLEADKNREVIM